MDYTVEPRLKQLDVKIQETESRILEEFKKKESSIMLVVNTIKADILKGLNAKLEQEISKIKESYNSFKSSMSKEYADLNAISHNISNLTNRVNNSLKKLNNINGYIASNNFKTDKPTQEQLTEFAIKCISTSENKITKDLIPNGTKIKNTYNQHIWVFNHIFSDGLIIMKWEDFGADNICIASNDGIHGLVTGSQNKFRGFIDINGVISINNLEEELNSIMQSIIELNNKVDNLKINMESMEK